MAKLVKVETMTVAMAMVVVVGVYCYLIYAISWPLFFLIKETMNKKLNILEMKPPKMKVWKY